MAMRRFMILVCLALPLLAGTVLAFVPQLPLLLREGFPSETWPAEGQFLTVQGAASAPADLAGAGEIAPAAQDRFSDSGARALLVDQGGAMSAHFADGIDEASRLNSFSLVKSLVGALVLRAHSDGLIPDLDVPLAAYLDPEAPDATIRQALSMTSGLISNGEPAKSVDDEGFSPFGPLAELHAFGVEAVLPELEADADAQGVFAYQSVNTALLGAVLEQVHDRPLPDILSEQIWQQAGAAEAYWRANPSSGNASAYCCLYARPLDWLLVGRFLLENGATDAPFLPEALWQDWLLPQLSPDQRRAGAYGWHLRHDVLDREGAGVAGPFAYFMGHGGQMVYLLPEQDAVVVCFGETPQLLHSTLYELLAPQG